MVTHILDCLQDSWPSPSNADIDRVERELRIRLPSEYRAFLSRYNGGHFAHSVRFEIPSPARYVSGAIMHDMSGVIDDERWHYCDLVHGARTLEGFFEFDMLPIGFPLGDTLCLCIRGENYGSIFLGSNDAAPEEGEQKFFFAAPDMLAFINMLVLDPEFAKHEETVPIFQAVERGDLDEVRRYLDENGLRDDRNEHGQTLLMCSARNSWPKVVALLIQHGAQVNAVDAAGCTALHAAAAAGSVDSTRLLLAAGANVKATDNNGRTALRCATDALAYRVVDLLAPESTRESEPGW